jgi:hypothetical protein
MRVDVDIWEGEGRAAATCAREGLPGVKAHRRSLGLPNFLWMLVALAGFMRFSPTENRTRGCVSKQRGRKFGFAPTARRGRRDDKAGGGAALWSAACGRKRLCRVAVRLLRVKASASGSVSAVVFVLALLFGARAHASNCPISSGASTSTIQSAINSCASGTGNTLTFAAGTYNITGTITVPCTTQLTITGPTTTPATAILSPSFTNQPIFNLTDCTGITIEYITFTNTQSIKFNLDPGTWCGNGCLITHNQFTGLTAQLPSGSGGNAGPACDSGSGSQGNCDSAGDTALTFANTSGAGCPGCSFLTNTTISYNQFGDASSCLSPANVMAGTTYDYGGNCAGIQFYTSINGVTVEYNNFIHVEEGFHVLCGPVGGDDCSGSTAWTWTNFTADYNDFSGIHRIGAEMQLQGSSNVNIDHNSYNSPTAPFF